MIPHVTDAIQHWITEVAHISVNPDGEPSDICLIELGGTVGDIESAVYLEALQQFQHKVGIQNVCMIHVGLVPVMGVVGEQKTKPCQHSVKLLREAGIRPDFLFCRSEGVLGDSVKSKLSLFCQTPDDHVISLHDCSNTYRVPLLLHDQRAGELVLARLGLPSQGPSVSLSLVDWTAMADRTDQVTVKVNIAVVGKYTGLSDSYLSVIKGLKHAALEAGVDVVIHWVAATDLEDTTKANDIKSHSAAWATLESCDGVLVPGGFGDRGVEGKILSARYCREKDVPYFGICLGLQTAVISFARDILSLKQSNSAEFDPNSPDQVVIFMPEVSQTTMGGTMRLGLRNSEIKSNSMAYKLYGGQSRIAERHRHRYEVNPKYVADLERAGMLFTGVDKERMEIAEIATLRFFVACQFHPEFTSRPRHPNPLFLGFVLASAKLLDQRLKEDGGVLNVGSGWSRPVVATQ
jgi:CTP synthase